jgi:AcrR family transcriptional regulator
MTWVVYKRTFTYYPVVPRTKVLSDDALVDLALDVIQRLGPERFTLADVARAASLSPATMIQRFGSKAALLARAIGRSTERLDQLLHAPVPGPGEAPRDALIGWLVELGAPFRTRALVASHLEVLRLDLLDPQARRQARRHGRALQARIRKYLAAAAPGRRPAEIATLAATVEAHWHGLVLQWAMAGDGALGPWLRRGLRRVVTMALVTAP